MPDSVMTACSCEDAWAVCPSASAERLKSKANAAGTMPTRMSTMSPMPFWPSLEPCAKLTPVQVSISRPRIHMGGALPGSGAAYRSGRLMHAFKSNRRSAAQVKPTTGETNNDIPTSEALDQLMPSPNLPPLAMAELARPTPKIAPTRVCELEAGSPRYQVPRFQMIAEINRANTMAKPAPEPTLSTNSTGNNAKMPNATAPVDVRTPIKFQ